MKAKLWELAGKIDAFMTRHYVITGGMLVATIAIIMLRMLVMILAVLVVHQLMAR